MQPKAWFKNNNNNIHNNNNNNNNNKNNYYQFYDLNSNDPEEEVLNFENNEENAY